MSKDFSSGKCDICADGCGGCLCATFCAPVWFHIYLRLKENIFCNIYNYIIHI